MSFLKKTTLAIVVAGLVLAATPAFAVLDGVWQGSGDGKCIISSSMVIYPWENWKGNVQNGLFLGEWSDSKGNHGEFKGALVSIGLTTARFEGEWYWIDGTKYNLMGNFIMNFNFVKETCKGEWQRYLSSEHGSMKGKRIP
jgi:hypothetical protein